MLGKDAKFDIGRVVASRVLIQQNAHSQKVTVSIGCPRRLRRTSWECRFLIEGMGAPIIGRAGGVDTLQALLQAVEGVRVGLEQTGHRFVWLDPQDGLGLPFLVPLSHGKRLEDRVRKIIDQDRAEWEKEINNYKARTLKRLKRVTDRERGPRKQIPKTQP